MGTSGEVGVLLQYVDSEELEGISGATSSKRWKSGDGAQRVGLSQAYTVESYQHIS